MRRFTEKTLQLDRAEAILETHLYDMPNETVEDAVSYTQQFVSRYGNSAELQYGYLPEEYADALVTFRDENSSYDLNAIVNQLCVDGQVSEPVTEYDTFAKISLPNSFSMAQTLWDVRDDIQLDETKTIISSAREIIEDTRGDSIVLYVPEPVGEELHEHVDAI